MERNHVRPAVAEPRQSVDRVRHPKYGEAFLVLDNGPACLVLDDGSIFDVVIGTWAVSAERTTIAVKIRGVEAECDVLAMGDRHRRHWSELLGPGWLVDLGETSQRFDGDEGGSFAFSWTRMTMGRPARRLAGDLGLDPEESEWTTFHLMDGSKLVFRRKGPPAAPPTPGPEEHIQVDLFGPPPREGDLGFRGIAPPKSDIFGAPTGAPRPRKP